MLNTHASAMFARWQHPPRRVLANYFDLVVHVEVVLP